MRSHVRNMAVKATGRQTIETKYHGPTNSRGARVTATSSSGHRVTVSWDYALNTDKNHEAAAEALIKKLGWEGNWVGGGTKGSGYVFVDCGR